MPVENKPSKYPDGDVVFHENEMMIIGNEGGDLQTFRVDLANGISF